MQTRCFVIFGRHHYYFQGYFQLIIDIFVPFSAIVNYIEAKDEKPLWEGLLYASAMFLVANVQTIILHVYFTRVTVSGLKVRSAVYGAVYRKVQCF